MGAVQGYVPHEVVQIFSMEMYVVALQTKVCVVCVVDGPLVQPVFVGAVQGHVAHAVHRVRALSPAVGHRPVAHPPQHDQRSHLLRTLPRTHHQPHTVTRLVKETVQRESEYTKPPLPNLTRNHFIII